MTSAKMSCMVDDRTARIVGGANVPTAHMRVDATWPLAVLEIAGPRLSLTLRWPGRVFGAESLSTTAEELQRVYPVRRFLVSGVGFTDLHGRDFYFWTRKGQEILDSLRGAGYPVSEVVAKPSKVWRGTPWPVMSRAALPTHRHTAVRAQMRMSGSILVSSSNHGSRRGSTPRAQAWILRLRGQPRAMPPEAGFADGRTVGPSQGRDLRKPRRWCSATAEVDPTAP